MKRDNNEVYVREVSTREILCVVLSKPSAFKDDVTIVWKNSKYPLPTERCRNFEEYKRFTSPLLRGASLCTSAYHSSASLIGPYNRTSLWDTIHTILESPRVLMKQS